MAACPRCSGYLTRERIIDQVVCCTSCSRRFDEKTLQPFGAQQAEQEQESALMASRIRKEEGGNRNRGRSIKKTDYYKSTRKPIHYTRDWAL